MTTLLENQRAQPVIGQSVRFDELVLSAATATTYDRLT